VIVAYGLIHERRIGEYTLPDGSVIVAAGNRAEDNALVRPMSSALVNRLVHVHLRVSTGDWLEWAAGAGLHPLVLEYVGTRPDHLWSQPPKHEEPFSTPRSWHMLSDALQSYGDALNDTLLEVLAHGTLSPSHAPLRGRERRGRGVRGWCGGTSRSRSEPRTHRGRPAVWRV